MQLTLECNQPLHSSNAKSAGIPADIVFRRPPRQMNIVFQASLPDFEILPIHTIHTPLQAGSSQQAKARTLVLQRTRRLRQFVRISIRYPSKLSKRRCHKSQPRQSRLLLSEHSPESGKLLTAVDMISAIPTRPNTDHSVTEINIQVDRQHSPLQGPSA